MRSCPKCGAANSTQVGGAWMKTTGSGSVEIRSIRRCQSCGKQFEDVQVVQKGAKR